MESLWLAVRACAAWDVVVCHIGGRGHTRAGFATTKQRLWLGWQYTVCSGAVTCRFNSSLRGSFVSVHRSRHTKQRFRRTCLHVSANACRSFFHPHRLQSGNKMSFCLRDTVSFFSEIQFVRTYLPSPRSPNYRSSTVCGNQIIVRPVLFLRFCLNTFVGTSFFLTGSCTPKACNITFASKKAIIYTFLLFYHTFSAHSTIKGVYHQWSLFFSTLLLFIQVLHSSHMVF